MINLKKKRDRLLDIIDKNKDLYSHSNKKEQLIISSSLLNIIWNSWSDFWRNYWIVYITGGLSISESKIIGLHPEFDSCQACAFVNQFKRHPIITRYRHADTIPYYGEPNWGDPTTIINIASGLISQITDCNYLVSFISIYKIELEEFQKIRNTFIHLNKNTIKQLQNMQCNFIFTADQSIIDILDAKRIGNSNICFYSMLDNMSGLLNNL